MSQPGENVYPNLPPAAKLTMASSRGSTKPKDSASVSLRSTKTTPVLQRAITDVVHAELLIYAHAACARVHHVFRYLGGVTADVQCRSLAGLLNRLQRWLTGRDNELIVGSGTNLATYRFDHSNDIAPDLLSVYAAGLRRRLGCELHDLLGEFRFLDHIREDLCSPQMRG